MNWKPFKLILILALLLGGCKQIADTKIIGLSKLVFFLIGAIFGSGALWSFLRVRYRKKTYILNETKLSLELRSELFEKLLKLIAKSERVENVMYGKEKVDNPPNELKKLKSQIELLSSDIIAIEKRLAKIEGRKPRDINLKYVRPKPPTGLRIVGENNET
jgi:hypothetical protein